MKSHILTLGFLLACFSTQAQNILLINDNDFFPPNTDTLVSTIQNSNYVNFTYYDAIDSAQMPAETYLANFDIVIYYASTDGGGLRIWSDGQDGNLAIKNYLASGGRAWIIGSEILFAGNYLTPTTFASTSFVYENMGIESYNVQSYGDDGNLGVDQVDFSNNSTIAFPDSLTWIFNTLWWVDGVTTRQNGTVLYEMGPASYSLAGEAAMVHYQDPVTNVMSTFFDPALIDTLQNRIDFVNASLYYLWPFDLSVSETKTKNATIKVYPTIAQNQLTIESKLDIATPYEIYSISGQLMKFGTLEVATSTIGVEDLSQGVYFIKVGQTTAKFIKQ